MMPYKSKEAEQIHNKNRWINNKENIKERSRKYYQTHKKEIAEIQKKYYEDHKEQIKERNKKYSLAHRKEYREYNRKYELKNKDRIRKRRNKNITRNSSLRNIYGITLEEYNEILEKQNGCCAICGRNRNEFKYNLHVDHNHETGKIRGLLCHYCNIVLGNVKDNPDILYKAIKYLEINNAVV